MNEFYRNCERVKRNIRENKKDVEDLIIQSKQLSTDRSNIIHFMVAECEECLTKALEASRGGLRFNRPNDSKQEEYDFIYGKPNEVLQKE